MKIDSTVLLLGSRAIGKAIGMSHSTVCRWSRAGLLPTFQAPKALAALPDTLVPYWGALLHRSIPAAPLLRRRMSERPLTSVSAHPGGGGLMPARGALGLSTVRGEKKRASVEDSTVVVVP